MVLVEGESMTEEMFTPTRDDLIAVALNEPSGGTCCFVGWIDQLDEHGILIDVVDWFIMQESGRRHFVPWNNVHGYLSCTKGNEDYFFSKYAQEYQTLHTDFLQTKLGIDAEKQSELRMSVRV
jgi:hypothetical protein